MMHARLSTIAGASVLFLGATLLSASALAVVWDKKNLPPPAPPPAPPAAVASKIKLELVTRESVEAVGIEVVPGDPVGRLFVVEKQGPIRILKGKTFEKTPFYDMTGKV